MILCFSDTPSPYQEQLPMNSTETRDYTVQGMTCSHCVLSVREEVSEVPGVLAVDVDLDSGRMTVTGQNVPDDAVRDAVADAGYEVAV
jgi:copper chaperone CopZ